MIKVSFRSLTPFEGSGKSDLVTFAPVFGGTPSFEDILRNQNIPLNDTHTRDWNPDDDLDHSYLTDPNYKFQERLRELINRTVPVRGEKWEAVDRHGKRHKFDSLDLANQEAREKGIRWKSVMRIAQTISPTQTSNATTDVIAKAARSCVLVRSNPADGSEKKVGSGFYIGNDLFITCAHVIKSYNKLAMPAEFTAKTATIQLEQFGLKWPAELAACSLTLDLAILRSQTPLPALNLASAANFKDGTEVLAIGCPIGFENNITAGILSSKNRKFLNYQGAPSYLFTDAHVLPGSSGGALIDQATGSAIGIISMIVGGTNGSTNGLNAALPAEYALQFLQEKNITIPNNQKTQ